MNELIVGTRGSKLALAQTMEVCRQIRKLRPQLEVRHKIIVTRGDRDQQTPLPKIGDKGLFTMEIEAALLDGSLQLAVHSCKDLPTRLPAGLGIGAIPERAASGDVLVSNSGENLFELPAGSRVGTGSLRRTALLQRLRPDVNILPLRGNIDTRLQKLDDGLYDAIILARAGIERLGLTSRITADLPADRWYYAPGQGAIAIECRQGNIDLLDLLLELTDTASWKQMRAERAFLHAIGGGCRTPTGVRCKLLDTDRIMLAGMVAAQDGSAFVEGSVEGPQADPQSVGRQLARLLLKLGAMDILKCNQERMP